MWNFPTSSIFRIFLCCVAYISTLYLGGGGGTTQVWKTPLKCKFCIHLNIDVRGPAMRLEGPSELRLVEVRKMKMRVQDVNMVCHSRAGTGTW